MTENMYYVIAIAAAYFLGSISPSSLLAKAKGIDIHKEGSGNPGTTNTLRVLGAKAAAVTLVVDILKGVVAVSIGFALTDQFGAMCCAFAAFIGHCYPVEMKFKGGKGVAVAFGVLLRLHWQLGIAMLIVIVLAVLITRKVSMGSIIAACSFPFFCWYMYPKFIYFGTVMAALVLIRHRSNIVRLIHHEESNISFSKKAFKEKTGEAVKDQEDAAAAGTDTAAEAAAGAGENEAEPDAASGTAAGENKADQEQEQK
ncbi:MAG: glycerol-3-phosphate 1-O-acyltransferase PlsY [Anaerovoracaceae bacterium]|jgi:glycerol-3-phosphate acyltransferase PlsY